MTIFDHILRAVRYAAIGALLTATLLATPAIAQDYPTQMIRLVVPFEPGGSNDRFARALVPYLTAQLNVPVVVENRPGAGTLLGHTYFLQQEDDGYTLLVSAPHPYLSNNIITQRAPFTLEEFSWLNLPWEDVSILVTANGKPYQTLSDLLDAIRENPGRISIGVVANSADHINARAMLAAADIDPSSVNWVTYSGGGPLRAAIAGGHVDAGSSTADGTLSIIDLVRPLVNFGTVRLDEWDAPPITEVTEELGLHERGYLSGSIRGIGVSSSFRENYPDRWQTLLDAVEEISANPENQQVFEERGMHLRWIGPERSREMIDENYNLLVDSAGVMSE